MTQTASAEASGTSGDEKTPGAVGRVTSIRGPVVDVEFPRGEVPDLFNALNLDVTLGERTQTLTLEVAQHLGDNQVRTISMQPTDGMVRGQEVQDSGGPITVPVGDAVKGHLFSALGDCLDDPGYASDAEHWGIHRDPPPDRKSTRLNSSHSGESRMPSSA